LLKYLNNIPTLVRKNFMLGAKISKTISIVSILIFTSAWSGPTNQMVKIATLNMHGYHPMDMPERFIEDSAGKLRQAISFPFYFEPSELRQGNANRLEKLGATLAGAEPDFVLLQELAFHDLGKPAIKNETASVENSDLNPLINALSKGGKAYEGRVASAVKVLHPKPVDPSERIIKMSNGKPEIVYEYGAEPYATGVFSYGLGILVSKDWTIDENLTAQVETNRYGHEAAAQLVVVRKKDSLKWHLLVNFHGGHKLEHFEQAIAIKEFIERFISRHPNKLNYSGAFVAGDMNARKYRPTQGHGEFSTMPWEVFVPGEFDFREDTRQNREKMKKLLTDLNRDNEYKPWANVETNANQRITDAINRYFLLIKQSESLRSHFLNEIADPVLEPHRVDERVDLVFSDYRLRRSSSKIIGEKTNYHRLDHLSDHPLVIAAVETPESLSEFMPSMDQRASLSACESIQIEKNTVF
jgi:hypothetical protein